MHLLAIPAGIFNVLVCNNRLHTCTPQCACTALYRVYCTVQYCMHTINICQRQVCERERNHSKQYKWCLFFSLKLKDFYRKQIFFAANVISHFYRVGDVDSFKDRRYTTRWLKHVPYFFFFFGEGIKVNENWIET